MRRKTVLTDGLPDVPYVIQARQFIDEFNTAKGVLKFVYRGFGKTLLKIGGLKPAAEYRLELAADGRQPVTASVTTDAQGVFEYRTQLEAPQTSYAGTLR